MDGHVTKWIGAYLDGELDGSQLENVERHLGSCTECREELEALRKLTKLLQSVPAAQPERTPERFADLVKHRLPRIPARSSGSRLGGFAWRSVPFLLIGFWAFSQVVLLVSGFVSLGFSGAGLDFPDIGSFPGWTPLPNVLLNELGKVLLDAGIAEGFGELVMGSSFLELTAASVLVTGIAGVLLWSWLASWLAYSRSNKPAAVNAAITRA